MSGRYVCIALLCFVVAACGREPRSVPASRPAYVPEFYTSDRIDAMVVDAETRQPVSGAVVVAVWRDVDVYVERWSHSLFGVAESVTDAQGRFTIHRWGPRMSSRQAFIDKRSPELWVLKTAYTVGFFDNSGEARPSVPLSDAGEPKLPLVFVTLPPNRMLGWSRGAYARPAEGSSLWNGKTLLLQQAQSPQQLAASLAAANPFELDLKRKLSPLPRYWEEWHRSRDSLPADLRAQVPDPPLSLVDFTVPSRR